MGKRTRCAPWFAAVVVAILVLLGLPIPASADTVLNNVGIFGASNSIPPGGSTTVSYFVLQTGGDGGPGLFGCNVSASKPGTLTITAPAEVSVGVNPLTFTACGLGNSRSTTFSSSTVGTYQITVSMTGAGPGSYNTSAATFTLRVAVPNQSPTVTVPADPFEVEANTLGGATISLASLVTATDPEDGALTPICVATPFIILSNLVGYFFVDIDYHVSCIAFDSSLASDSESFVLRVVDTNGPVLSPVPADQTIEPTGSSGAVASYATPTATDVVWGMLVSPVTCGPLASGSVFPVGATTVTCSATDGSGNVGSVSFSVTVNVVSQTIAFGALGAKTFGDANFGVSATASSGLVVAFSSSTASVCTVSGSTVHLLGGGLCTIRADQAGNGTYSAAPPVSRSFTVNPATQAITFAALGAKTFGDADFGVSATASSGLVVAFSSSTPSVCTVSGSTVHIVGSGLCTIRADQAGGASYNAAPSVSRSFAVNPATVAVSGGSATLSASPGAVCSVSAGAVPAAPALPGGLSLPYGLISFTICGLANGETSTVTITLPGPAAQYWKLANNAWHQVTGTTSSGNQIAITLTDGGPDDEDGVANGTIVDPGAPGTTTILPAALPVVATTAAPPAAPTTTTTSPQPQVRGEQAFRKEASFGGGDDVSPTPLIESIPTAGQLSWDLKHLGANALIVLLLLLLIGLPAEMLNSTIKAHYDEMPHRKRFPRLHAFEQRVNSLPGGLLLGGFSLIGALVYSQLDPDFGFDTSSMITLGAMMAALLVVNGLHELLRVPYFHRVHGKEARLRTFPMTIVAAIVLVIFSRLFDFQPGFIFGITCGLALSSDIADHEEGRSIAIASGGLLVLAVTSWLLWIPVQDAAVHSSAGLDIVFFNAFLSILWVAGLQAVLFGLVPLRFLNGEKVVAWSRRGWLAIYGSALFFFVQALAHPSTERWGGSSKATVWSMLGLFIVFSTVAVLIWAWFRFVVPRRRVRVDA